MNCNVIHLIDNKRLKTFCTQIVHSICASKFLCIAFIFLLSVSFRANGQVSYAVRFNHITNEDGLSSNFVTSTLQDKAGFLWIATHNGLNRFDGYQFKRFTFSSEDPFTISSNQVNTLFEDTSGSLWIGTYGAGICRYDKTLDKFIRYAAKKKIYVFWEDDQQILWVAGEYFIGFYNQKKNEFEAIEWPNPQDNIMGVSKAVLDNHIWVATENNGLYLYNTQSREVVKHYLPSNKNSISSLKLYNVFADANNFVWIGTQDSGMDVLNLSTGLFTNYRHDPKDVHTIPINTVTSFLENGNTLLVGTQNGGLSMFDKELKKFTNYTPDTGNSGSINSNSIAHTGGGIYRDRQGRILISTHFGGVNIIDPFRNMFGRVELPLDNPTVNAIVKDRKNRMWLATEKGIVKIENNKTKAYPGNPGLTLAEDSKGRIWAGTHREGLKLYDEKLDAFISFMNDPKNPKSIFENEVASLLQSPDGKWLYIATRKGLSIMPIDHVGQFENYTTKYCTIQELDNFNFQIQSASDSTLWICTRDGLVKFDLNTRSTTCFRNQIGDTTSISDNTVYTLYKNKENKTWVGLSEGLNHINSDESTFNTLLQGIGARIVIEDDKKNLWLGTNNGLMKFNPSNGTLRNYNRNDGLEGLEFRSGATLKDSDGTIYVGHDKGLLVFHPDSVKDNLNLLPVHLTDLKVFNKSIQIGANSILTQPITQTNKIVLAHTHSIFSLDFVGIDYSNPAASNYAYLLEGFENEWNYVGKQRTATYTNLPAGRYTFRVKAANSSNLWNDNGVSLVIEVLPAWWNTLWFRALAVVSAVLLLYVWYQIRSRGIRKQNQLLEQIVNQRTKDLVESKKQSEAANAAKSEFLANMSHELRTPLNGVIGFSDLLVKTPLSETQQQYVNTVSHSAHALLNLVNDVLDFSKIEAGKLELSIEKADLYEIGGEAVDLVKYQAQKKGLEVLLHLSPSLPRFIWADEIRLRQIIINLLGNAVKFTEKGEIELKIEVLKESEEIKTFRFTVRDTGIGIAPENQKKIFEVFSQGDASTTKRFGGTGLGLNISNSLLALMNSKLELFSEPGIGSTFYFDVTLRADNNQLTKWDNTSHIKNILIVDDNASNRIILKEMLSFHTINSDEASSGFEAIEMIRKGERYEAIIMDYHMPGMDGLETVRKMRAVLSNSDQPVILLYSSSDDERINSECEELDIRQRLVKPAKINKLFESLSKLSVKYQSVKDIPSPLIKEQISKIQTPQLTILIAEDNVVNMFLTRSIIEGLLPNARIVEADNGLLAVDKYRNEQPNIVFMDIRMPEKNGYEAATAIRQIEKSTKVRIPIVALTAGTAKGEKEKCLEAGMDDYISKPIIQDSIQKALIKWLHIYAEVNLTARNNLNESESHKHFNLGELKNQLGNDTEVVRKLVSTALSNIDECIGKLRQNKLQTESFSETLHMLKGIALSAGFNILAELVLQLEEMHRYSDANKNKKLIEIENEVELIKQLVINSSIL